MTRKDVLAAMRALADDLRPAGATALKGHRPWLRIRAGDYRVIYAVDDTRLAVLSARRGDSSDVYMYHQTFLVVPPAVFIRR